MTQGHFAFVLHSHLPYVLSHGRWPHGTDWLCEAAAETYLPLIKAINELTEEGLHPKLTIGLSPVLCEQLTDDSFKDEFVTYLNQKTEAARFDASEFEKTNDKNMLALAHHWESFYSGSLKHFNSINQNILPEFKILQDKGYLEIITCGATHGYFPLLSDDISLQVQTKAAVKNYQKHFGQSPKGIWLPECAYRPGYNWSPPIKIDGQKENYPRKGAEEFLAENNIEFFIVDSVLLKGGKSAGVYIDRFNALKKLWQQFEKSYQPREEDFNKTPREAYLVSSSSKCEQPVAIFARDPETGLLVWSGEHGYPGDGNYLDFHKKRSPGGLRYWAVTSSDTDLGDKKEYHLENVNDRLNENASHFSTKVAEILNQYYESSDKAGILVAPYDTELFGHWWYEGPRFLKQTLRNIIKHDQIELTFLSDHLKRTKPNQVVSIPEGSWGQGNNHYIWLNKDTEWSWTFIYEAEARMTKIASYWLSNRDTVNDELTRMIKQAGRELMLLCASDWQFLISTGAAIDYAELRLNNHYSDFTRLANMIELLIDNKDLDEDSREFFDECSQRDSLFEELEIEWFAQLEHPH